MENKKQELQEQFLLLFDQHRHALWRFVRQMVWNVHDVEDIVQETTLIAYKGIARLRDHQAFASYLFTVASRQVKKMRWKRMFVAEQHMESYDELPGIASPPDVLADVALLHEALKKLPTRIRETVVLFELSGLSLEEVQAIQKGTLSGVKSRLRRGRQQLAAILGVEPVPPKQTSVHITHQPIL
jgi:RNA polymerase sigma-70 factor, ECF subfamily